MAKGKRNADDRLLQALAFGASDQQAAQQCGLSIRTVYRRKADPEFQRRLQAVRADLLQRALGIMTLTSVTSAKTFLDLQKEGVPPPYRLGAARSNMQYLLKMREHLELEPRIAALEEQNASERSTTGRRTG
jgi:hypothetical protein